MSKPRIKLIKQFDKMDCGPACLAMIMSYYGNIPDIQQIRDATYLGRNGISLRSIAKAAENFGFSTIGGRITFDLLTQKAHLPCIIHWDQSHFVVIYKIKKNKKEEYSIYVADPLKEYAIYSKEEFCKYWISTRTGGEEKGVVLLMQPTESFSKKNETPFLKKNRLKFLWKYIKKYSKFFNQLILGLLIGSIIQLIFPFLTQAIVDTGIGEKDISFIWLILLAQLMLLFSRTAIEFIRNKILLHISVRINISLISDFFIKLMKLPMKFFDTKLIGDLIQRIEDHKRVEQFLTSSTLNLLFSFFTFIIFGIVLFLYSIPIFIVFIVGSIVYGCWITFFLKKRRKLDFELFEQSGRNRNVTYQLIKGMQEIKLQGCEQRKRWEWEDVQADLFDVNLRSLNLQQTQQAISITINELKNIIITILAATSVINGNMTIGMMLAVQYIIGQLNAPVDKLVNFIYSWQDVSLSLDRMNEIHSECNEENDKRIIPQCTNDCSTIKIQNLCFSYTDLSISQVLKNINLTISQEKVTAIVGASGSGKTTILKLLLGYYTPQKGEISIGNEKLEHLNLAWWRNNCGVVMQDSYLFSDTIARNIAVSDDEIDLERIHYAAHIANLSEYIESLPLAYNTLIGQDGQGISEGQKQRILIARVVYKNPRFIFLDEATNALDAKNERMIVENLSSFYKGKTVIVVAHRLSTVRYADQIIVLDNGTIIETGTHDELTEIKGKYYELVKNQLELGK